MRSSETPRDGSALLSCRDESQRDSKEVSALLTFKNLDVYDVTDPEQSLMEALREYPELREFEDVLIEDEEVATLLKEGPRKIPEGFVRERLEAQGIATPKESIREALSDYGSKPPASKKAKKPKASKAKPREESPKGIWDKLDLL